MTEFKVNSTDDGKPSTLKVPLALIGPLWGILMGVGGLWFTMYNTQRDQGQAIALVQKDVTGLKGTVTNIERTVGVYSDSAYTMGDAARDQADIKRTLDDHETRIRALEKRRR